MNDDRMDEVLAEAARAYAQRLPELPASLDDRIMAAVRARPVPLRVVRGTRRPRVWRWLVEPQPVRPAWGIALAAAAALAIWLLPRSAARPNQAPAALAVQPAETVYVRFELAAPTAHAVSLAGSFNGWDDHTIELARGATGVWSVTLPLPVGEHRYQFVVDGAQWVPDPTAHAQMEDGFGGRNSVIVVGPKGVIRT